MDLVGEAAHQEFEVLARSGDLLLPVLAPVRNADLYLSLADRIRLAREHQLTPAASSTSTSSSNRSVSAWIGSADRSTGIVPPRASSSEPRERATASAKRRRSTSSTRSISG